MSQPSYAQVVQGNNATSSYLNFIFKNLVVNSSSVREKALLELLAFLEKNEEAIETSFEHFLGIFEKMATDGSATSRMVTMKIANLLLKKLKKAAAKGMKKIIPMVFYQLSDSSNSVASAAETLLRENFSPEKRGVAFELFGPIAIEKCVEIATGKHELCQPAKYDEDESVEQRKYRLEIQALNTIQKIAEVLREKEEIWVEGVSKLYEDVGFVKKSLGSDKPNLKATLITLCLQLPNHTEIILNSPISQWIIKNLDSKNEHVCEVCWNAFVVLLRDKKNTKKISITKKVLPRLVFVIRTKHLHWLAMDSHMLPAITSMFGDNCAENAPYILKLLHCFPENLPFDASLPSSCRDHWFSAFLQVITFCLLKCGDVKGFEDEVIKLIAKTIAELIHLSEDELLEGFEEWLLLIIKRKGISDVSGKRLCEMVEKIKKQKLCEEVQLNDDLKSLSIDTWEYKAPLSFFKKMRYLFRREVKGDGEEKDFNNTPLDELLMNRDGMTDEEIAVKLQRRVDSEADEARDGSTLVKVHVTPARNDPKTAQETDEWNVEDDDELRQIATDLLHSKLDSCLKAENGASGSGSVRKHDAIIYGIRDGDKNLNNSYLSTGDMVTGKINNRVSMSVGKTETKRQVRMKETEEKSTMDTSGDANTRLTILKLINQGVFDSVEGIIYAGKDSTVLHAQKNGNTHFAIKVFRTEYVKDDFRFKNPDGVSKIWGEKEYMNLTRMEICKLPCPQPVKLKKNLLIMSMVGDGGLAAPRLKNVDWLCYTEEDIRGVYEQVEKIMCRMYKDCRLVHGDLNEYNLLLKPDKKVFVVDVKQAMDLSHPKHFQFLTRDIQNVLKFFEKIETPALPTNVELFNKITDYEIGGDQFVQVQQFSEENRDLCRDKSRPADLE